jgi:anti-sigma factor RsiW
MNTSQHPVEQVELMAFLDGELTSERAATVAAHLQQCGECRVAVAESRDLAERLSAWQVEPAPASLTEHVTAVATSGEVKPHDAAASLPSRPRFPQFAFPKWVWATAGVLCLILIIAAISMPNLLRSRQSAHYLGQEQTSTYLPPTTTTTTLS